MQPCYLYNCCWEVTFLYVSRLATLLMHGLNMCCAVLVVSILCFRVTILSVQRLLTAPFLEGVSQALGISACCCSWNLAFFYIGTAVFFIDFCKYFSISFCGYLGPVKLYIS